ncbi:hypothetical protein PFICI_05310 [Pestalotiopsis fici W106-1]|uniref:Glycosyltransferase 2-like domain-containing protein n=1 Tax=Pestalotiopsis fici (strain W106-1 / CGMCC3.15140) TaxID=1229662 RepID=W3XBN0_PESFW|nr:uncharacterized protein PFICI_05310 [Pestalotiopsis fici W106-1]ETS83434.1 hypothetical protein PFICI_05310 [Pestalotiopsis fici W106-1]
MAWGPTLTALAFSALLAVLAFCFLTVPYLVIGPFTCRFFNTAITVGPVAAFVGLFAFRYWRLFVNIVAYRLYRPAPRRSPPTYTANDVTVICPTVEPHGDIFRECTESVCTQEPRNFFIVVGHESMVDAAEGVAAGLRVRWPKINIRVEAAPAAGKRIQIDHVAPIIDTAITICVDDHVFWPLHRRFFPSVLAAFEDQNIRLVGTNKRVRIEHGKGRWSLFWNMIGSLYLTRHNFEIMASNWVDGGVFVVSGRTFAIRSDILRDADFRDSYTNEMIGFLGMLWGPLSPDDDNFITRWIFEHGFGVRIQSEDDSEIETTLGWFPKHLGTSTRWARTTFRSNPRILMMRRIWETQPWSIYAVYIAGMINFAVFWDFLLCYMWQQLPWAHGWADVRVMVIWILATKLVKTWPHFRRYPSHLIMFPGYVAFAYYHSLIKFWALLTIWDCAWTGRNIAELAAAAAAAGAKSTATTYGTTGSS